MTLTEAMAVWGETGKIGPVCRLDDDGTVIRFWTQRTFFIVRPGRGPRPGTDADREHYVDGFTDWYVGG